VGNVNLVERGKYIGNLFFEKKNEEMTGHKSLKSKYSGDPIGYPVE
jgi:hypothetical protein